MSFSLQSPQNKTLHKSSFSPSLSFAPRAFSLEKQYWKKREDMEVEKRTMVNRSMKLPIGYRFHPTDQELILHYLLPKAFASPLPSSIIPVFDVFFSHPLTFPGLFLLLHPICACACLWSIYIRVLPEAKTERVLSQVIKRRRRGTSFPRREEKSQVESRFHLVMVIGNLLGKREKSLPVVEQLGLEEHLLSMKQTKHLLNSTKLDGT